MAKNSTEPVGETFTDEELEAWQDIKVGLGTEWDLEKDGILTGKYTGSETVVVEDKQNGGTRDSMAYRIEPASGDPNRFIWGSYNIDEAFKQLVVGQMVRIEYLGVNNFTGDKGPQQIKSYRIQAKPLSA